MSFTRIASVSRQTGPLSVNAIDTNILIYAADSNELVKGPKAIVVLDALATPSTTTPTQTVLLWQVMCEFSSFLAKSTQRASRPADSRSTAFAYMQAIRSRFPLVLPSASSADLAIDIHLRDQVSIWDAWLIAACVDAGVTTLYTEDLQGKPIIRGVQLINPLA